MFSIETLIKVLSKARGFSFGTIVLGFLGAVLYAWFPNIFSQIAERYPFIIGCALLGGALQRLVEGVVRWLMPHNTKDLDYFEKVEDLRRHLRAGLINRGQFDSIMNKLMEKRFLGEMIPGEIPIKEPEKKLISK